MRIAIFTDTYRPQINGVATSVHTLRNTLLAHGEEVLVVCPNPYYSELSFQEGVLRVPGLELKNLYDYRLSPARNKKAEALIEEWKPDIIHIQTEMGIGMMGTHIAEHLHLPLVYTYHTMYEDYTHYATHGLGDQFAKALVRAFTRGKVRRVDEFITPSEKIKDYMRTIGVDVFVNVIPTGIDIESLNPKNVDMNKVKQLKSSLGLNERGKVILSLGRVAPEKSIDVLLKGYANYLSKKPKEKTVLLIVGGGPSLEGLQELSQKLGIEKDVIFVGAVSPNEVQNYYQLGDIFVAASLTETQGLTFMEAMASRLLMLVRYDDSISGTISDQQSGFFFFDEFDFSEKLEKVLSLSPKESEAIKDKAVAALAPYSLQLFYERIMEVYRRAIRKNW